MPLISDYASLGAAITSFAHRQDILSYQDYFIQGAQEAIQNDLLDLNFGNGVRFMEASYGPIAIAGGITPVPPDWWVPKAFQVSDGAGDTFPLIFKHPSWLYGAYPIRQAYGMPAYIARDVIAPCAFTGSIAAGVLTVSGLTSGEIVVGTVISGPQVPATVVAAPVVTGLTGTGTGGAGTYPVSNTTLTTPIGSLSGGGNVFVFGPYPDSDYTVQGTYYQAAPQLSVSTPTNWMVTNYPLCLHAACMVEVAKFLLDDTMLTRWATIYKQRLQSIVDADKGERWAASTMQIQAS